MLALGAALALAAGAAPLCAVWGLLPQVSCRPPLRGDLVRRRGWGKHLRGNDAMPERKPMKPKKLENPDYPSEWADRPHASTAKKGEKRLGVVVKLREFGALVDVGYQTPGLLHMRCISPPCLTVGEVLEVGQTVRVWINDVQSNEGQKPRLSLTMFANGSPAQDILPDVTKFKDAWGFKLQAVIATITDRKVFVMVRPLDGGAPVPGTLQLKEYDHVVMLPKLKVSNEIPVMLSKLRVARGRLVVKPYVDGAAVVRDDGKTRIPRRMRDQDVGRGDVIGPARLTLPQAEEAKHPFELGDSAMAMEKLLDMWEENPEADMVAPEAEEEDSASMLPQLDMAGFDTGNQPPRDAQSKDPDGGAQPTKAAVGDQAQPPRSSGRAAFGDLDSLRERLKAMKAAKEQGESSNGD